VTITDRGVENCATPKPPTSPGSITTSSPDSHATNSPASPESPARSSPTTRPGCSTPTEPCATPASARQPPKTREDMHSTTHEEPVTAARQHRPISSQRTSTAVDAVTMVFVSDPVSSARLTRAGHELPPDPTYLWADVMSTGTRSCTRPCEKPRGRRSHVEVRADVPAVPSGELHPVHRRPLRG
jgi:hypothetical protein